MNSFKGILLIYLLVWLSFFGNHYRKITGNNIFILILLIIIPLILVLVSLNKVNSKYYPYLLHSISLALLFHQSFAVDYIFGSDIFLEKSLIDSIIEYHYWDSGVYTNLNGMLSLTTLAPSLSLISGLSVETTLRAIYPFIFSFVPLILYLIYINFIREKYAFISVFLFMSFWTFFTEMLQLARQMVAEFVLVFLLLLLYKDKSKLQIKLLLIIFTLTLITSHYGTTYLFLFILCLSWFALFIFKKNDDTLIGFNYLLLYITLTIFWYGLVTSSSIFDSIVNIVNHMLLSIHDGFISTNYQAQAAIGVVDTSSFSLLRKIKLILQYSIQVLISIGLLGCFILKKPKQKIYYAISFFMFFLLIGSIAIPVMAGKFNMTRIFHFTLLVLSPYFIVGIVYISKFVHISSQKKRDQFVTLTAICILVPYFWSTTGVLYDVFDDSPVSVPLGIEKMKMLSYENTTNSRDIAVKFGDIPTETDILSARWTASHTQKRKIYSDYYGPRILQGYTNIERNELRSMFYSINSTTSNNYCYLRSFNTDYNVLVSESSNNLNSVDTTSMDEYLETKLENRNKIYSSKHNVVYLINNE